MRPVFAILLSLLLLSSGQSSKICIPYEENIEVKNQCITYSVSAGTGCAWMCNYCAAQLGTNNYYFTTDVCTYQMGGCVGNPQAGVQYTCCAN